MKIYVNPPEGHLYGFPKVYAPEQDGPIREWLVKHGYPTEKVTPNLTVRTWAADKGKPNFIQGIPTLI